jgi:hypothetical protein
MKNRERLSIAQLAKTLTCIAALTTSCSKPAGFESLYNRGPLLLSNLYLAQEAEKSVFLRQFMNHHGAPTALEVVRNAWGSPELVLYYPHNREVYSASLNFSEEEKFTTYEWIIRGPFPMRRADYLNLKNGSESRSNSEPVLLVGGEPTRYFKRSPKNIEKAILSPSIEVKKNIIVKKTVAPKKDPKQSEGKEGSPAANPTTEAITPEPTIPTGKDSFRPLNSDEQAIAMSKGFVQRAANGDAIHTVGTVDEDLKALVLWYTKSEEHIETVARRNNLIPTAPVPAGKDVVIPFELLQQFKVYRP